MPEGTITARTVRVTGENRDVVEVIASLDSGEVVAGMFIHVPFNPALSFTTPISSISPAPDGCIRIVLDCDGNDEMAGLVLALNIEGKRLKVLETGER